MPKGLRQQKTQQRLAAKQNHPADDNVQPVQATNDPNLRGDLNKPADINQQPVSEPYATDEEVQDHQEASSTDATDEEAQERAEELAEVPEHESFPYHKGGGYYVLSNGDVVRGEEKAEQMERDLAGGNPGDQIVTEGE